MPRSVDIFSARHYSRGPCAGTAHHRSLDTVGAGSSDADAMSWKLQPITLRPEPGTPNDRISWTSRTPAAIGQASVSNDAWASTAPSNRALTFHHNQISTVTNPALCFTLTIDRTDIALRKRKL